MSEDKGSQDKGSGWSVFGSGKKEGGGEKKGAFARAQIDEDVRISLAPSSAGTQKLPLVPHGCVPPFHD